MKLNFGNIPFPRRIYQYLTTLGVNIAFLSDGMHYGWPAPSIPLLTGGNYTFQIDDSEGAWLVSMLPIGSFIGGLIAVLLTNLIGRKKVLLFTTLPFSLSWFLIALAPSASYMFVGRFIAGLADGVIFSVGPAYLSEIADPGIRGLVGCTYPVMLVVGMLLMNIIQYWSSMPVSCYIGAAILLSLYSIVLFVPDSPYFYLMKKDEAAATKSLQKFTGHDNVSEDIKRINIGLAEEETSEGSLIDMFRSGINLKLLTISLFLGCSQELSGNTAINSYSTNVFEESKDIMDPFAANLVFFAMILLGSVLALLVIDYFGRKKLLIASYILTIICLAVSGGYLTLPSYQTEKLHFIPFVSMQMFALVFSAGVNTIPILLVSEILPAQIRSVGLFLANFTFSICSTLTVNYFTWSTDEIGRCAPFFTFAILSAVWLLMIWTMVPETKDKTLEEIQIEMRGEKKVSKDQAA